MNSGEITNEHNEQNNKELGLKNLPKARIWLAIGALSCALFTVYGSFLPFEFQDRTIHEAIDGYMKVWKERLLPQSRSDGLANCLLGIPFGFCVIGALCLGKKGMARTIFWIVLLVPLYTLFAALVEFGQLWIPKRTCAASDAFAQGLGAALGMGLWLILGEKIMCFLRGIWDSPKIGGRVGRALVVYSLFLIVVQTLPWDITASPVDWYRKGRTITYIPFQEITSQAKKQVAIQEKTKAWIEQIALFLPLGLIASSSTGLIGQWRGFAKVVMLAMSAAMIAEIAQWPVISRSPSVTDIIIDFLAIMFGWFVGRLLADKLIVPLLPALFWFGVIAIYQWWPLDFDPSISAERIKAASWMPFVSLESKQYMFWLEEVIVKIMIFMPIGAVFASKQVTSNIRIVLASMILATVYEIGQLLLPGHFPSVTDIILAGMGGFIGGIVTRAILGFGNAESKY